MGSFTCPHCKTINACNCNTCSKYVKEGESIVRYTEDGNFLICGNKDCDKMFSHDQAIDQEYEKRLEKYSERFDNKDNELVKGIFNPDTWGKRIVKEPKKVLTEEDIFSQKDIDAVTAYINKETSKQKRSYSEEEVLEIIRQYALEEHLITSSKPDIWFEQFKKK
jgi:hypothetical protein